jgi:hypothetical protein
MVLHRWDSSTTTLTADGKGRIACRNLFPPHASFDALKEPDGRVTLIRLRREAGAEGLSNRLDGHRIES